MMNKNCLQCAVSFIHNNPRKKYCSASCQKRAKCIRQNKVRDDSHYEICSECEILFVAKYYTVHLCSDVCISSYLSRTQKKFLDIPACIEGADRKLDKTLGYVRLYVPMHPEANTWGYVYEHRVIAEQMIGRCLEFGEIVHHKNGKRWDNRPENLEVMDKRDHAKLHGQREEDLD